MLIPLPVRARIAICNIFGRSRQDYNSGRKGEICSNSEWLESLEDREGEECFASASVGVAAATSCRLTARGSSAGRGRRLVIRIRRIGERRRHRSVACLRRQIRKMSEDAASRSEIQVVHKKNKTREIKTKCQSKRTGVRGVARRSLSSPSSWFSASSANKRRSA